MTMYTYSDTAHAQKSLHFGTLHIFLSPTLPAAAFRPGHRVHASTRSISPPLSLYDNFFSACFSSSFAFAPALQIRAIPAVRPTSLVSNS